MANLKNIQLKILSVKKTRQVTKAMEAVSAVKMRKTQEQALKARPYAAAALSVLQRVSGSGVISRHPLAEVREGKTCLIIVTSDKGLAGALNSNLLRLVDKLRDEDGLTPENTEAICIGRRGSEYLSARGFSIKKNLENVSDEVNAEDMRDIADKVLLMHGEGSISKCVVAYTNFVSTFEQLAVFRRILPLSEDMLQEMVAGITPVKGKFSAVEQIPAPSSYTVEPSEDEVLAELMPKLFGVALFHALAEAKASEHSARMVAMKNATDKAGEVAETLTLKFNKARQAAITAEVSEITSGMESIK